MQIAAHFVKNVKKKVKTTPDKSKQDHNILFKLMQ